MKLTRSLLSYFLGCSGPAWTFRVTCDGDAFYNIDGRLDESISFHRLEVTALPGQEYQVTWQCCVCPPDDDPPLEDYFENDHFLNHCQVQPEPTMALM